MRELRNVTQDLLLGHVGGQGTPIPINDVWIAALVLQHGATLHSLDADFDTLPQLPRLAAR